MTVSETDFLGCVADEIERTIGKRPSLEELFDEDADWMDYESIAGSALPTDLEIADMFADGDVNVDVAF